MMYSYKHKHSIIKKYCSELVFLGMTQAKTETHSASFSTMGMWLSGCVSLYIVYSTVYCVHVACNCAMIEDHTHCITCSLCTLMEAHSSYSV